MFSTLHQTYQFGKTMLAKMAGLTGCVIYIVCVYMNKTCVHVYRHTWLSACRWNIQVWIPMVKHHLKGLPSLFWNGMVLIE